MSNDWKSRAIKAAYGCFFVVGAIHITFFLVFSLGDLDSFPGAPLIGLAIVAGFAGFSLALVLWREWPLLVMTVLSLAPLLVEFGVIRWPPVCTNFWTDGLCVSVVEGVSGLLLLFIPLRFFLFKKGSTLGHRLVLIGLVASASWASFILALNSGHIRRATSVLKSVFNTPPSALSQEQANQAIKEASKASHELENLVGLIILVPVAWMAVVTLVELLKLRGQARHPTAAPGTQVQQGAAPEPAARVEKTESSNWKWWATRAAYGCFLALGSIYLLFFLVDFLPLDEGCSMSLAMFGLIPLMTLMPVLTIVGLALALIQWREWPLLIMASISVLSQLASFAGSPIIGKLPLPEICTDVWTSAICQGTVITLSGLILLFFSIRFFLDGEQSKAWKRIVLAGLVTSVLWTVLIAGLNLEEIRAASLVLESHGRGDQVGAAARQLGDLVKIVLLMPITWGAATTVGALVKRTARKRKQAHQAG